ncbi:uncharacterized protein LOC120139914 isoform X2 [Hibiscus syriacus]|uniref:uncharacterized protein LOC120139914 isoform X2 n=1 Tax=Hibiscus syriacus TaxID=106335 RepID=UPI001924C966|nr:uncharacterized protein LOC120139914 isoform X2 [Hibiscus syriacus]
MQEALVRLFYNLSSSSLLLLLFLYSSSILLSKFLFFIGTHPLFQRSQIGYDSEEEEEEEYGCMANDHLVADIIHGGESLVFLSENSFHGTGIDFEESMAPHHDDDDEDEDDDDDDVEEEDYRSNSTQQLSAHDYSSPCSDSEHHHHGDDEMDSLVKDEEIPAKTVEGDHQVNDNEDEMTGNKEIKPGVETDFSRSNDKYFDIGPTKSKSNKLLVHEEIYGDSCTTASTSKSSSEWRSSITCRDSTTDDPFSSSSRRSCPKWESYTVFQKYDEEMTYLHRLSAQKLQETESLRSIQACPKSISGRIVHKFSTTNKRQSSDTCRHNPYNELEAAYVAQICLTWEALNWNYSNFERKRAARKGFDCPATIAQQFQQFQVLLQRYIENEPYEHGRRPEVYARKRLSAPKLLLVPEYRDYEDDQREESSGSRISADSFLVIIEDGIQTFMNFLKADREKPYQIIKALFRRKRKGSVDPTLVRLMKKVNAKVKKDEA